MLDAVVIGGGLAGLAAATWLGRAGGAVALLERAKAPGGRAASLDRDGFRLNLGAHALYRGEGLARLRDLGLSPEGFVPDGRGWCLRGGALSALPGDLGSLLTTELFELGDRLELARVLGRLLFTDPAALEGTTLEAWLSARATRPAVRAVIEGVLRVACYASAPGLTPAALAVRQLRGALKGVLYLNGGWQSLVDGLAARAAEAGVALRTGTEVAAVAADGDRWRVTLASCEALSARSVVIAAAPAVAHKLAPEIPALAQAAAAAVPGRVACLDLGLRELPRPEVRFVVGLDEPLYYSVHSGARGLAPEGRVLLSAMWYRAPGDTADRLAEIERGLDLAQPGWREQVVTRRYLPSLVAVSALPLAAAGGQAARPGPAVPGAPGLYLAGDWVGPRCHLADASLASAWDAAQAALARSAAAAA